MKTQMLSILDEVAKGTKSPITAQAELLDLFNVSNCPAWLDDEDYEWAKMLFKENKLNGVKYLMKLAKPHIEYPLRWSKEFLEGCC